MSENTAANVSTGRPKSTGAIFVAPEETILPADAVAALDAEFKNLGFISTDGLTNSIASEGTDIFEWGGGKVLTVNTSYSETFKFKAIENNAAVLKEYWGEENVTEAQGALTVIHSAAELEAHPWVFETVLNGGRIQRTVVPHGKVSARGDIVYVNNAPIGYEFTISAAPDETGATAYTYIAAVAA